jgi:2-C-methyl-D-erythritol 4-phosphate cytidylyltransferase
VPNAHSGGGVHDDRDSRHVVSRGDPLVNTALILAAGSGRRTGQDIPKQFIPVFDKPVLLYTLESFQRHPQIDAIEVVCLDGWQEVLKANARQFGIDKLKWVTTGGKTAQESIRCGVFALEGKLHDDDIVVVHDGIRPLVDESVLSDVIAKAQQYGNAVSSLPYNEQIFVVDDEASTTSFIPRETIRRVMTPQAYTFGLLRTKYHEAFERGVGILGSHYTNTMMVELGVRLYFASGSDKNIKLTTKDDIELFKAHLRAEALDNGFGVSAAADATLLR